ncbi:MAG: TolC family protein [Pirellulaceae bacterium]
MSQKLLPVLLVVCCSFTTLETIGFAQDVGRTAPKAAQITLLESQIQDAQGQLDALEAKSEEMQLICKKTDQELHQVRDSIEAANANLLESNFSQHSFPEVLAMLQTMRVQLRVDLAGLRARKEADRSNDERIKEDLLVQDKKLELASSLVELAKKRTESASQLYAKAMVSSDEILNAKHELMNAEIRLLEMEAETRKARTGVVDINRELILDMAEKEARLAEVETMLGSAAKASRMVRDIELQLRDQERIQSDLTDCQTQLRACEDMKLYTRRRLDSYVEQLESLKNDN